MEKVKILGHDGMCLEDVPEYTTSIAAAWAIVEKFRLIVHPYGVKWLATPYNSVSDWHMLFGRYRAVGDLPCGDSNEPRKESVQ